MLRSGNKDFIINKTHPISRRVSNDVLCVLKLTYMYIEVYFTDTDNSKGTQSTRTVQST